MKRGYYITAAILFLAVAVLHALRAGLGWPLVINDLMVPTWLSWVVAALLAYLSFRGFSQALKMK
jgi:hypothetical protein